MGTAHTTIKAMILAAFLTLSLVEANLIHPTPTVHNGVAATTMPEPTSPATRRSRFGFMNENVLFPRQEAAQPVTCAYEEADPLRPITCAAGSDCQWEYGTSTFWGPYCCPTQTNGVTESNCGTSAVTTCIDYGSNNFQPATATRYQRDIYCGSNAPICGTLLMSVTPPFTFSGLFTKFFCGNSYDWTISAYWTSQDTATQNSTTLGTVTDVSSGLEATVTEVVTLIATKTVVSDPSNDDSVGITTIDTANGSSSAQPPPTDSASEPGAGPSSSSPPASGGNTESDTVSDTDTDPDDKSNTAAIAGGVGGGVGGALAIAGVIGYLVWRKKNQRKHPVPEISS